MVYGGVLICTIHHTVSGWNIEISFYRIIPTKNFPHRNGMQA